MHECLLCKRDMKVSNSVFGNGCVRNIYSFLDLKMPRKVNLREETLYRNIMRLTKTKGINNNQKLWLTDRYLTYQYLNRIPYGNYNLIKNKINNDIQNIKQIEKDEEPKSAKNMSLKQAYDLYKKATKFQDGIDKISKGNFTDEDSIKAIITSLSFIFNMAKNKKQYEKDAFKAMQYAFWQTVIEEGGRYFNYEMAAKLLQNSLEENPKDYIITEQKMLKAIKEDNNFKDKIKEILNNHKSEKSFYIPEGDEALTFEDNDLYFAIHIADIEMKAEKDEESIWDINIKLSDTFDFTKLKMPNEYYNDAKSVPQSLLSSTLYNLAFISFKLGVIKEYKVIAELSFKVKDGEIID